MSKVILYLFLLSIALFIDYVFIAVLGCIASSFNATDSFFCGPFCYMGIAIITATITWVTYKFVNVLQKA